MMQYDLDSNTLSFETSAKFESQSKLFWTIFSNVFSNVFSLIAGAFGSVFGGAVYKKAHGQSFAVALKMLQPVHPGTDATGSQVQQFEMELR